MSGKHTNTVVDELGTLTNTALLTGRNWGTGIISNGGFYYRYGIVLCASAVSDL